MVSEIKKYVINGKDVWQGYLYKVNNEKKRTPIKYHIRPLTQKDAEQMGKLSENIYRHLKNGEECFIHKHNQEYFHEVFDNKQINYIIILTYDNNLITFIL